MAETSYLWYDFGNGGIYTEANRLIDTAPTFTDAANSWPEAVFRVRNIRYIIA